MPTKGRWCKLGQPVQPHTCTRMADATVTAWMQGRACALFVVTAMPAPINAMHDHSSSQKLSVCTIWTSDMLTSCSWITLARGSVVEIEPSSGLTAKSSPVLASLSAASSEVARGS